MLGHLGAILAQLGDKMGPESTKMSQDSTKSAKKKQDSENGRRKGGAIHAGRSKESPCPFKKHQQMSLELHLEAGGSTWNLVELRLETQPGNS